MVARNKETLQRFMDAANSGDLDVIDSLVHPEAVIRTPLPVPGLTEVFVRLRTAFPDLRVVVEDMVAEGDKVVCRNRVTGTHLGEYMGRAATGRAVSYEEMFVIRFVDGLIAETWGVVDVLTQMRQLGFLPTE
jgi:steroid delta-isomerase-like uncharacterized protein